jgi:glycosyltransferase involved in cell wall biosynthesis
MHGLMLAIEDNLPLLATRFFSGRKQPNLTGVIHYPAAYWSAEMLALLRRLDSALVLYRTDIPFFERYVGRGRVVFVPHGVDTEFFCPTPLPRVSDIAPRLLLSGQFGRDFKVLLELFQRLAPRVPGLGLDIVGAHHAKEFPEVQEVAALPGVVLHSQLSDEALLELYQTAAALVLPLEECGANNALVEALSCGLPVVATDVGGVRDYGGGSLFPTVRRGDAAAMADEVEALLRDPSRRAKISRDSRAYAERELTWLASARAHLAALGALTRVVPDHLAQTDHSEEQYRFSNNS